MMNMEVNIAVNIQATRKFYVNLTEDKKTALVSLQRTHGYEFVFKDIAIPFD